MEVRARRLLSIAMTITVILACADPARGCPRQVAVAVDRCPALTTANAETEAERTRPTCERCAVRTVVLKLKLLKGGF